MILTGLKEIRQQLLRVKVVDYNTEDSRLSRCLNTSDLVGLGVGSTLGSGVYVLAGLVAREDSGPAIVLSFLIAAFPSILAGLCFAEFGARVPKTGSAYLYSYVTIGELWAFITGWTLILSCLIGTSSVARAWSATFDEVIGRHIEAFCRQYMSMNALGTLAEYPDIFAVLIIFLLTGLLAFGVKESAMVTKVFTCINVLVLLSIIISGFIKGDLENWSLNPEEILNATCNSSLNFTDTMVSEESLGKGGFLPFGWSGVLSGAASCIYAFIGFDSIATTGEEVKNPKRAIPVGIMASLFICFVAYFGVSAALSVMMPYYLLDKRSPLPVAFKYVGWDGIAYVATFGSLCALSTSLLGEMLTTPRVIWAMAQDGLLFKPLAKIHSGTKTPLTATLMSSVVAAAMAFLFDLRNLVDLMSLGSLLVYTLVAACVLIIRYQPSQSSSEEIQHSNILHHTAHHFTVKNLICPLNTEPSTLSGFTVNICTSLLGVLMCCFSLVAVQGGWTSWSLCVLGVIFGICLIVVFVVWRQPQSKAKLVLKVPLLPFVPLASMFINIFLMMQLDRGTWIRFAIWMALGFSIYFGYGIHNSAEARSPPNSSTCNIRKEPMATDE